MKTNLKDIEVIDFIEEKPFFSFFYTCICCKKKIETNNYEDAISKKECESCASAAIDTYKKGYNAFIDNFLKKLKNEKN